MHDCLVAFGSNQGDSLEILQQTIRLLEETDQVDVTASSQPLTTTAVGGPGGQELYVNAAIRLNTTLSSGELHQRLVHLESALGRVRRERWGSRKIDLDLLLFDQLELHSGPLILPHPRMSFRRFVLEPAVEIAAEMCHVSSGRTLSELVSLLNTREDLVLVVGDGKWGNELGSSVEQHLSQRLSGDDAAGWRIRAISKISDFRELESSAKLICPLDPEEIKSEKNDSCRLVNELITAAVAFPGSTLRLPIKQDHAKTELVAAIEAMIPWIDANG